MTARGPQLLTTVILRIHFQSQTEWNRGVFSPLPSSAWYSLPCFTTLHKILMLASNWRTEQMGGVFNLRRLKVKTKVKVATLRELLFADDCALNSNTEAEMQQCVNYFSRACDNFGFTISTKKTEVMNQPAPRNMYHEKHIFVNDEPLKATEYFTYLGSTLSREANLDVNVNNRLSKVNSAFGRLRKKVWGRRGISQETKLKVCMAVVLTVLLYACESWTVYSRHARNPNHLHSKCLRIILSINWQDMVPDTEVLTRAGISSIHTLLQKAQVRWAGHVTRMSDDRLPKQLLYGELCLGKRSLGGQHKRFKDTIKKTLKSFNIDVTNWEVCAQEGSTPVAQYDPYWSKNSRNKQDRGGSEKRAARKAILYSTTSTSAGPTYPCPECGRVLQALIGLNSHLRTHRVNQTWHHHHHRRRYSHHRKRWTNNMPRRWAPLQRWCHILSYSFKAKLWGSTHLYTQITCYTTGQVKNRTIINAE